MAKIKKSILDHLKSDPIMATIIEGLDAPKPIVSNGVYQDLTKAIVYQQISTKAADSIYGRYLELIGMDVHNVHLPNEIDFDTLRSVGLSKQKATYIQNISAFFESEKIKDSDWESKSDEEIISYLSQIKGVGVWTVQMMLIFSLGRSDVFPDLDYAIQIAVKKNYKLKTEKTALLKEMRQLAEQWKPYRSFASRYLWQWLRENR